MAAYPRRVDAHVLERPADIYRPFEPGETRLLRSYVEDVRRLGDMRFFEQVPHSAAMTFGEGVLAAHMEEPDDQDLRAAITQFRQIYSPNEPHSFQRAIKTLKRSVHEHGSPDRAEALAALNGHLASEREAHKAVGLGIVFEEGDQQRPIDTRTIIDAYFHGHYLHSGNPKSELARRLDDLQPWPRYTLYSTMLLLRNVYWNAANAVERVLRVPSLLAQELPSG